MIGVLLFLVAGVSFAPVFVPGVFTATDPTETTPSVPVEPIAYEGQLGRVRATAPAGSHQLGGGYAIRIVHTHSGILDVSCTYDEGWHESLLAPGPNDIATRRTGKLATVGHTESVNMPAFASGLMGDRALEWRIHNEIIHVQFGTLGNDVFPRSTAATRCLCVGRGGEDVIEVHGTESDAPANHVLIDGEGLVVAAPFRFVPTPARVSNQGSSGSLPSQTNTPTNTGGNLASGARSADTLGKGE